MNRHKTQIMRMESERDRLIEIAQDLSEKVHHQEEWIKKITKQRRELEQTHGFYNELFVMIIDMVKSGYSISVERVWSHPVDQYEVFVRNGSIFWHCEFLPEDPLLYMRIKNIISKAKEKVDREREDVLGKVIEDKLKEIE